MDSKVSINIENCNVEGIDAIKRVQSLRQMFVHSGSLAGVTIPILNDINFSCVAGERVAFIGSNGSGKSSLLKLIAGIYPPKSGKLQIHGSVTPIIEMGLGMEFEFTGRQNIKIMMLYSNMLGIYSKEVEEQIIEFSELGEKIDLPIKTYSSGMIGRLAFSTSIFQSSDILLLDEVFATGDSHFVGKSLNFMENKIKSVPITILVSHSEEIIKEHCNRCILMKNGKIITDGSPHDILAIYNSGDY